MKKATNINELANNLLPENFITAEDKDVYVPIYDDILKVLIAEGSFCFQTCGMGIFSCANCRNRRDGRFVALQIPETCGMKIL